MRSGATAEDDRGNPPRRAMTLSLHESDSDLEHESSTWSVQASEEGLPISQKGCA